MTIEMHFFENLRQIFLSIVSLLDCGLIVIDKRNNIDIINSTALDLLDEHKKEPEDCIDSKLSNLGPYSEALMDKIEQLLVSRRQKSFTEQINISEAKFLKVRAHRKLNWIIIIIDDLTSTTGLLHEATHDHLTQLFNRRFFENKLEDTLLGFGNSSLRDSIALLDLNGFKVINDLAGYICGDEVLKKVSTSILSYIGPSDIAARIGGDEFAIIFKDKSLEEAKVAVGLIRKRVNELEVYHPDDKIRIDFSAGITQVDPETFQNSDELIAYSMAACRLAKQSRSDKILTAMPKEIDSSVVIMDSSISNSIANALIDNSLVLFGQMIQSKSGTPLIDVEILLRLRESSGGYISPSMFIPVAERFQMMGDIDRWVVTNAFQNLTDGFRFFLNISGHSFCDSKFCKFVALEAKRHNVNPEKIVFEITETQALNDLDSARMNIANLQMLGFKIALDDFGAGFSSLLYLKSLPVDIVKIDGQIVKEMHFDDISLNMVKMICSMAKELDLEVVVEFVHCKEIYDLVRDFDVDFLQGFFVHEPMNLAEFIQAGAVEPSVCSV